MGTSEYIVILCGLVNLIGSSARIWDTIQGRTQPNRTTWLLWALAPMIATAASLSDGAGWVALPIFISGFCPLLVFLGTFVNKGAYWKTTAFDYVCGGFSLVAMALWQITQNADWAIFFAILSDGLAALPTVKKSWTHPWSENAPAYFAAAVNAVSSFLVVSDFRFSHVGFPIYLTVLLVGLPVVIYARRPFVEPPQ